MCGIQRWSTHPTFLLAAGIRRKKIKSSRDVRDKGGGEEETKRGKEGEKGRKGRREKREGGEKGRIRERGKGGREGEEGKRRKNRPRWREEGKDKAKRRGRHGGATTTVQLTSTRTKYLWFIFFVD